MHKILLFLTACCFLTISFPSFGNDSERMEAELNFLKHKSLKNDVKVPYRTKSMPLEYENSDQISLRQSALLRPSNNSPHTDQLMKEVELMDRENQLEFSSQLNQDISLKPYQRTRKRSR